MMKLVDMRDLGSRAAMRWGSSPHTRTNIKSYILTVIIGQNVAFYIKIQRNGANGTATANSNYIAVLRSSTIMSLKLYEKESLLAPT